MCTGRQACLQAANVREGMSLSPLLTASCPPSSLQRKACAGEKRARFEREAEKPPPAPSQVCVCVVCVVQKRVSPSPLPAAVEMKDVWEQSSPPPASASHMHCQRSLLPHYYTLSLSGCMPGKSACMEITASLFGNERMRPEGWREGEEERIGF